jgi:hypothetical protein
MLLSADWVVAPPEETFFGLFPHRFDYIYAPHSHSSPDWQTQRRHPLTDRLLQQGSFLYGVRFGTRTSYCLLDIDAGSIYHPHSDPLAIDRIVAALEPLGLVSYLACTSSYSGGLHLYLPFGSAQSSWQLGAALTALLENAGFLIKPGQLELFPNRRSYSIQGKPNLFNGHRLPLQSGSYLLNSSFEPVWADRAKFVQQWQLVQRHNQLSEKSLRQILKQSQRQHYQVSGRAAKFLNDLNAEIELGWTGSGQTNYLLGRITLRTYVFHHILTGEAPLGGETLAREVIRIAQELPGYRDWCQHQHELEHRVEEWVSCIENSRYFPYGSSRRTQLQKASDHKTTELENNQNGGLSWNQQQCQTARERIQTAVKNLLNQGILPRGTTARFKALTDSGIGGSSLYKHKDLWHPEFLRVEVNSIQPESNLDLEPSESLIKKVDQIELDRSAVSLAEQFRSLEQSQSTNHSFQLLPDSTSLFPGLGRNAFIALGSSCSNSGNSVSTGCNSLIALDPVELDSEELNLQLLDLPLDLLLDRELGYYWAQRVFKPP